jgi:hypothetical protein
VTGNKWQGTSGQDARHRERFQVNESGFSCKFQVPSISFFVSLLQVLFSTHG